MQLDWVIVEIIQHTTVLVLCILVHYHHRLFMITTTVNLVPYNGVEILTLMILCGMVKTVLVITAVVLIPAYHGSIVWYHWPLVKILRHEFAVIQHHLMKIYLLENCNCMYSGQSIKAMYFACVPAWFLEIIFVHKVSVCMCVFACACVCPHYTITTLHEVNHPNYI